MTEFVAMHSYNDTQQCCIHCESSEVSKLLSRPIKIEKKSEAQAGQITKEYIESNKEILEDLKKESRSENYEPS
jgi:hypothetical protein